MAVDGAFAMCREVFAQGSSMPLDRRVQRVVHQVAKAAPLFSLVRYVDKPDDWKFRRLHIHYLQTSICIIQYETRKSFEYGAHSWTNYHLEVFLLRSVTARSATVASLTQLSLWSTLSMVPGVLGLPKIAGGSER